MSDGTGGGAAPDPASVDWTRLRELREEIGDAEFAEVVDLFLAEADAMIDGLAGMAPSGYEAALHALKGAATNLGLTGLAALCAGGERLAASGRPGEVRIAGVLTAYAAARAALVSGLGTLRAGDG